MLLRYTETVFSIVGIELSPLTLFEDQFGVSNLTTIKVCFENIAICVTFSLKKTSKPEQAVPVSKEYFCELIKSINEISKIHLPDVFIDRLNLVPKLVSSPHCHTLYMNKSLIA